MLITVLKSKIHRATVTEANIHYNGSCSICKDLMEAANIAENEQIQIYNVNNGERFTTYAISSDQKGVICLNGSAARLGVVGDKVIICAYGQISMYETYKPHLVFVNDSNVQEEH